ncbi:hypothetical protein AB0G42_21595 [Streptomyces yangpuensis]|uniref:hypothetical protein n=1 Tax=Streptomyces yangpuensis TaxID=1648182 RepID=UPI00342C9524
MFRHAEGLRKIGAVKLEEGEGYSNVTVEVTTVGGVQKLLRISESEAAWLKSQIADALAERPEEGKAARFKASVAANGRPAPTKD